MPTVDQILKARTWRDLNANRSDIKSLRKSMHPDVNHDPKAHDAFIRLNELFRKADIETRYATGLRIGGIIEWRPQPSFLDLHKNALTAMEKLSRTKGSLFLPVVDEATSDSYSVNLGSGWYLLDDFDSIDARSTVWIAKRMLAAIIYFGDILHGDINSANVLIHPEMHGLIIEGWQASVRAGTPLICKPSYAPTKYLGGAPADQQLSVAQAMDVLTKRFSDDSLLSELYVENRLSPQSPAALFDKIDKTAQKLFGPNKFHKLDKPNIKEI